MKTMKFLTYAVFILFLGLAISSCKGDDGADGIAGAAGASGLDGQDGNANVQTLTIDASGFAGSFDSVSIPELTQDVIDNDVILGYLSHNGSNWAPIPCPFDTFGFSFSVHVLLIDGSMVLDYGDAAGNNFSITAGDLHTLKVVIIESSGSKSMESDNAQEEIYAELKNAGVDINDYKDVCNYYGINP